MKTELRTDMWLFSFESHYMELMAMVITFGENEHLIFQALFALNEACIRLKF